jgi:hypothetical protein
MTVSEPRTLGTTQEPDEDESNAIERDSKNGGNKKKLKKKKKGKGHVQDQDSESQQVLQIANYYVRDFVSRKKGFPTSAELLTGAAEAWREACEQMGIVTLLQKYAEDDEYNKRMFGIVCTSSNPRLRTLIVMADETTRCPNSW